MKKSIVTVLLIVIALQTFTIPVRATQSYVESPGNSWLSLNSNTGGVSYLLHNASNNSNLEFAVNNNGSVNWQVLNINKNGNVGIGTTTARSKLHAKSEGGAFTLEGSNHVYMEFFPDSVNSTRKAWFGYGSADDNWITLSSENGGGIVLNPGSQFVAVTGLLKANQIKVTTNLWPDYVFEDGYQLKSLSSIEDYIKQNNHLPGVPSSKDIVDNGISLGDMSRLQMEKIEELTLHLIEKDKKIGELEARLEKIEVLMGIK